MSSFSELLQFRVVAHPPQISRRGKTLMACEHARARMTAE